MNSLLKPCILNYTRDVYGLYFRSLECCQIGHGIPNIKPRLFVLIRPYWTKVSSKESKIFIRTLFDSF